jgi:intraflagellar transport protein 172
VNKLRRQAAAETGGDGTDFFLVRARMAMLRKEWKQAEAVLLEQGRVSEAVAMYTDIYR